MSLLDGFQPAYCNVVLNSRVSLDAGSKFVIDDRDISPHGAKLVTGSIAGLEAGLVYANANVRMIKVKGLLTSTDIEKISTVLERHMPDCESLLSINLKAAEFIDDENCRPALARLSNVLLTQM